MPNKPEYLFPWERRELGKLRQIIAISQPIVESNGNRAELAEQLGDLKEMQKNAER